jgi:hypothetical protein
MIEARDIVIERMTKGEAIDAKILYILGQMDIDSAIDVSKIDKLSDPLVDDAYTLEKVVVKKPRRQNKKINAKDPEEMKDETPQDGVKAEVDVVQDIIDDAIDIEEVVKKPRRQNKRRDTTVPVIEAIEKSLYKTQSPNQPKKSSPAFPKNPTSTYKI